MLHSAMAMGHDLQTEFTTRNGIHSPCHMHIHVPHRKHITKQCTKTVPKGMVFTNTLISPLQLCKAAATQEYGNPSNQVMEASPSHLTAARKPIMNVQYSFNVKTGFADLKCLKRGSQQRVSRAKGYYCVYQEE